MAVAAALAAVIGAAVWLHGPTPDPTGGATTPLAPAVSSKSSVQKLPELLVDAPTPAAPPAASVDVQPPTADATPSLEDMIGRVMPAVVLVETGTGRGSGFFISRDMLLTNVHVVGTSGTVTIQRVSGVRESASVVAASRDFDVAVLKVSNPDPRQAVIAMGATDTTRVGEDVIAIGSALGTLQNTVTRGIVSAIRHSGNATLIQTDAAVNPGNSGGPLLDRNGTALGITTMGYRDSQGLNFAVSIDHAKALVDGRPEAPSAASVPADTPGLSPAIASDTERARQNGSRLYVETIVRIATQADALDADWRQFRGSCYQTPIAGTFDREWLAALDARAMRDPISSGCKNWFALLAQQATLLRDGVVQATEAARRAGVYPGVQRDTLQKYRLQVQ